MTRYEPVRLERGVNHGARRAHGLWWTVCGRQLDERAVLRHPRRQWDRVWELEQVCKQCDTILRRAASERDLDRHLRIR